MDDSPTSDLKRDERVVFFTTDASPAGEGRAWKVPIHAWVHELEKSRVRKWILAGALEEYGLEATAETESNFDRRVQLFLVDNERGKTVVVRIAGETVALPATEPNGHSRTEIELGAAVVARAARGRDTLEFSALLSDSDGRAFSGRVHLVARRGISVVSDIDDTVKLTEVTDLTAMLDRTFYRDFEPVPGMAELYTRWAREGAAFHFVSSSPWQLYEPLDELLTASGFPPRSLSLKRVRVKDETLLDLFKEGTETKPAQIEPILARFPGRRFVLVGDSGEQDPEVYGALLRKYPEQIARAYIRNVTGAAPADDRFRSAFASVDPERWSLFTDPAELELPR